MPDIIPTMWRMPTRMKSHLSIVGLLALSLGAVACTGVMDGNNGSMAGSSSTGATGTIGSGGAGTIGPGTGGNATVPGGGDTAVDPNTAKTMPVDPGHVAIHRLNTAEYNATVLDVLGTKLQPADSNWRGGELGGFDNNGSVLGTDADQYQRYFDAADAITKDVWANPTALGKILTCTTTDDATCVKNILSTTGLRIFRRPLTADELTTYANVYTAARGQGDDHSASVRLMINALLSSAEFLFRIEYDNNPDTTAKHALNPYELASRLSYFLWSSAPDDQLLAKAADGSLVTDAVLSQAVDYMLGEQVKSNRFVMNFAGQWLGIRKVVPHPAAPDVYPDWTPALADQASQEMYLYFNEFLRTGRTWLDFMKADINYVSPDLAKLYAMPTPAGASATNLVRVENVADGRRGFAGLAGFLALSSPDRRSSPTLRGKWLLLNVMCTVPPDPPPNVPKLEAKGDTTNANVRTVLEAHRANPACASCHALIDPFGLALEQYDGIGKFRTTYANMSPIDPSTTVEAAAAQTIGLGDLYPQGVKFSGIEGAMGMPGVADLISQDPKFATCISQKMLSYSTGRLLTDTDNPYLDLVNSAWLKDPTKASIGSLIHGLVSTETFRSRRGGT